MKILIIGGTQLTGPHIVRGLVVLGHEVTIFHRGRSEADLPSEVQHFHGDRNRLPEHAQELRRLKPDVVLDMMAYTEQDAVHLMETFRGAAGRVVVISSIDVYRAYGRLHRTEPGPPDPVPLTEDAPLREKLATDGLDYNKTAVERVAMGDPELPATILRYPAVYGPGDRQHRLYHTLKRMDEGRPAILLEETISRWRWSRGYSENAAAATVQAAVNNWAVGRIYNVAAAEAVSEANWIRQVGDAAGWQGEVVVVPDGMMPDHLAFWRNNDSRQDWVVDTTRIRKELGYEEPVSLEEGLRRTVAWERENPPPETDPKAFDYAAEDALLATRSATETSR